MLPPSVVTIYSYYSISPLGAGANSTGFCPQPKWGMGDSSGCIGEHTFAVSADFIHRRDIVARPSMVSGRDCHATHPVNAVLNYAYAVLESQVRIATVSRGLDPTIGYLHVCRPRQVALVYDLMEPLRPLADLVLLDFVYSHTLSLSDFILRKDGICRLHPQLARQVARMATSDIAVREIVTWLDAHLRRDSGLEL
jgi:hypothetical protein